MHATAALCFWLLSATSIVLSYGDREGTCGSNDDLDYIQHVHIFPRKGDDDSSRTRRSAANNTFSDKLSITVTYDSSFSSGLSSAVAQRLQNNVIPKLTEFFESVLSVRPLAGPLLFNRDCSGSGSFFTDSNGNRYCASTCETITTCGTATIPDNHLNRCRQCNDNAVFNFNNDCEVIGTDGAGVDTLFSLYISAVTTGSCPVSVGSGSTLAFAGSCEMEDEYDRTIAGFINFCPVSITDDQSDEYLITVAKHELLHALGFSSGLFGWWRDENGNPRSPRNGNGNPTSTSTTTLKPVTYTDWSTVNGDVTHTVSLLVTPKIMEEGRRHFNCSTLEGVQLEDQGGSGTAGSHWEARITKGEGMNGAIATDGVFSRLTFALLEDSGWYKVNYTLAEQLIWARGSGCGLATGSCGGYITSQQQQSESISPFCDYTIDLNRCNLQRTAVSTCNLASFSSALPVQYQYFSASNAGGSFQIADFCPFQVGFSNTVCTDTSNTPDANSNFFAQTFGPNSRCVEHGQIWTVNGGNITPTFIRSGCYNYACSNGQVTIDILGTSYICTTDGEELAVSQTNNGIMYGGSIICPSCLEICYDDFENCPKAAEVYSEFVTSKLSTTSNTTPTSTSTSTSTSTPTSTSTTPSATPDEDMSGSGDDDEPTEPTDEPTRGTQPSGSLLQATASFMTIFLFFVISLFVC